MRHRLSSTGVSDRLLHHVLRALPVLPAPLLYRLSGRPAVSIDGATLAPEVQLVVALRERQGHARPERLSVQAAREERRRAAAVFGGPPAPVGAVADLAFEGPGGELRARHYAPLEPGPRPLLVYYHGGGFTYGDLDTHDALCRMLCRDAGVHVLALDYRLAPEHRFPAAVEDAAAALAWAFEHAERLGADGSAIAVGGDSAGGNLAAVIARQASGERFRPAGQLLIYPVTDFTARRRSRELFGEGFLLSNAEMDWFEANYLGPGAAQASDARASPLLAPDLGGLAPAIVVTAGFDPLRDEGEEYAAALARAGTPVVLRRFPRYTHAFLNAAGVSPACRAAVAEIGGMLRALLELARGYRGSEKRSVAGSERPLEFSASSEA